MPFDKKLGALSLTVALSIGVIGHAFAESPPPDQTETDTGGGGSTDPGGNAAGNGGSGTNEAGQVTTPTSCYVISSPSWFPAGPPIAEAIAEINSMSYMHFVYYDTSHTMIYTYLSSEPDDLTPIPGTYETWTESSGDPHKPQAYFQCID